MILPPTLSPSKKLDLVRTLRAGTSEVGVENELILGHIRLAYKIAHKYAIKYNRLRQDLCSVAVLTLCKYVPLFTAVAVDDDITAWLISQIHYRLKDFIRDSRMIITPHGVSPKTVLRYTSAEPMSDNDNCVDLLDILFSCCDSKLERDVLQLRIERRKCREIAEMLGICKSYSAKLVVKLKRKFDASIKSEEK